MTHGGKTWTRKMYMPNKQYNEYYYGAKTQTNNYHLNNKHNVTYCPRMRHTSLY